MYTDIIRPEPVNGTKRVRGYHTIAFSKMLSYCFSTVAFSKMLSYFFSTVACALSKFLEVNKVYV